MKILISQKNFVVLQLTKAIYCFSFCEKIATFDIDSRKFYKNKKDFTKTNSKHYAHFKKIIQQIYPYY